MIKIYEYLKVVAKKLAKDKTKNAEKIEDFKTKLDIFLAKDRITQEQYQELNDILEQE